MNNKDLWIESSQYFFKVASILREVLDKLNNS